MKLSKLRFNVILGAMTALSLALPAATNAQNLVATRTTIITACGKLFSIDANAAGLTPEQRAAIVQKNLDNALIAAKHRTPDAVRVSMMNNNPIVTLDNFYIVTADANNAARLGMTQMQLAHKWADSIRMCMADATAMNKYISMLTGRYPTTSTKAAIATKTDIAVLPWGTNLPVQLTGAISANSGRIGDQIQAVLSADVPLGPQFNAYLPAGTVALGVLADAAPFNCNHFAGKYALTPQFYALRTPDGKEIPINGHILGGANTWRYVSVTPVQPNCAADSKAQISSNTIAFGPKFQAVSGTITGGWRGMPIDLQTQEGFHRLLLSHGCGLLLPAGEPMLLQLNSSSTVAVSTPITQMETQVSSAGIGM